MRVLDGCALGWKLIGGKEQSCWFKGWLLVPGFGIFAGCWFIFLSPPPNLVRGRPKGQEKRTQGAGNNVATNPGEEVEQMKHRNAWLTLY